jgi:hypothetical protein
MAGSPLRQRQRKRRQGRDGIFCAIICLINYDQLIKSNLDELFDGAFLIRMFSIKQNHKFDSYFSDFQKKLWRIF